jgi:hypothetical protein
MGRKRAYNKNQDRRYGEVPIGKGKRCKFSKTVSAITVAADYGTWYRVTDQNIPLVNGIEVYIHPTTDTFPSDIFFTLTGATAQQYTGATFGYRINIGTVANSTKTLMEFIQCANANDLWYQVVDITGNAATVDRLSFYGY